jgi:hypothetical protein
MIWRTGDKKSPNPQLEGKGSAQKMMTLPKWIVIGLPVVVLACIVVYTTVLSPDGATTLSWTPPTENENSEPLTDLAGYKVHCWAAENRHAYTISVDDPETTRYVIEGLEPGTYNCAISAVKTDGSVSALSNVVAKTVP